MEMSDQLHAHVALPPGKQPPYPMDRKLGGPQRGYSVTKIKVFVHISYF
jgi:hypothetical protein